MNNTQIAMYLVVSLLMLNKASRVDAFILFCAFSFYQLFVIPASDIYYYSCASMLNLCVGLCLHHRNKIAASCSYSLVAINFIGFCIYHSGLSHGIYDIISLIILITQLVAILPRGLINGLRSYSKLFVASCASFNSGQSCVTIHQTEKNKANRR